MEIISILWYYLNDYWIEIGDPRVESWMFVGGGLWKIMALVMAYLILIRILTNYMKNRKSFELKNTILMYNTFMVIVNAVFTIGLLYYGRLSEIVTTFTYPQTSDKSEFALWFLNYYYLGMIVRIIDWFDTIFFVLRRKHSQITFLHVYHHTLVPILAWIGFKHNALIPFLRLFACLNSAIHTLMYAYYSMAALGPQYRRYLWWKKYITKLQIIQFAIYFVHLVTLYYLQTGYPMVWFYFNFAQQPIFIYLFTKFYFDSYRKVRMAKIN